jgi:uncharacterized membrane protein
MVGLRGRSTTTMARLAGRFAAVLGCMLAASAARAEEPAVSAITQLAQATQRQAADERVLKLCNLSGRSTEVAKATPTGRNAADGRPMVESRGWYQVAPGQCIVLYGPGLPQRFYYYYAQTESGTWGGQYPVCVSNRAFTILDAQCGEGFMRRNFTQVDMGSMSGSFTVNLR